MAFHLSSPPARIRPALAVLLLASALPASAQMHIGAGSSVALGGGSIEHGCTALHVDGTAQVQGGQWTGITEVSINGTLHGGSGTLALAGQFAGGAGFTPETGTVRITDGCGLAAASIEAATSFHTLEVNTAQNRILTLPSTITQTIAHHLVLNGVAGQLLRLRASVQGQAAFAALLLGASQSVAYVDVADNHATAQVIAPGPAANYHSVQGSNVQRWFDDGEGSEPATPRLVPTLNHAVLALLAALFAITAAFRRKNA